MIITAHQPTYLPWLGLFNKIYYSDCFVLLDTVQYLPQEWMNRNKIKTANGERYLTVPVHKKGYLKKMNKEIKIDNSHDWQRKHLKSIFVSYKNTKYFNNYFPFFEDVYKKDWDYLCELNTYILENLLNFLDIKIKLLKLSELNVDGTKSDLVLNVCKKLNAQTYIFGGQGENYADINKFNQNNIKIKFQKYIHPAYNQNFENFLSNMSVIDLIFNCGKDSLEIINKKNKLI
jgi:hypothetical protein